MDRRPEAAGPPPHADLATQGPSIVLVRKQVAPVESPPKSSFRRRPESRGAGWHQSHPNTSNNQASFSYLGVPAPAGTSDWYESMSRTPIRDVPSNQPRCRLSTGETCRIVDQSGMRKCSAGACPPQGSGWGVAESAVPIRCTKPQLRLFKPWCAGTSRHERLGRK